MGSVFWFVSQTVSNFTQKLGENTLYGSSKENTSKYVSVWITNQTEVSQRLRL